MYVCIYIALNLSLAVIGAAQSRYCLYFLAIFDILFISYKFFLNFICNIFYT